MRAPAAVFDDEATLCAAIRAGNEEAVGYLFHHLRRRWRRYIEKRVGQDAAADVLQDALISIHRAIVGEKLHDPAFIWTYVGRTVFNECSSELRRRYGVHGQRRMVSIDEAVRRSGSHVNADRMIRSGREKAVFHATIDEARRRSAETSAETSLIRAEREEGLLAAIDKLRPAWRSVVLARLAGAKCQAIADRFGVPVNQVKAVLFRARAELKQRLRPRAVHRLESTERRRTEA